MTAALDPVVDDLSLYVRGGRLRSSADVVPDAVEAERLGLSRLWLSERYDLKEAGALLGGMAATTSRLKLGTAALFPGSRNVLLTAALGATMHSAYGPRFTLGLDYTGELLHETAEGVFGGSLSFPLRLRIQTDVNDSSCSAPVADGWQTCSSYVVRETGLQGNAFY